MPKSKSITYQCPRCGYENSLRSKIKRHLYDNKTICPISLNDIELTTEIREYVLKNHRYIEKNQVVQKVTNFNILNNFINQLDFDQKLSYLLTYQNKNLNDFGDQLENSLEKRRKRLRDNSYRTPYTLDESDYVTRVDHHMLDNLNVLFDKKLKRLKIYQDKQWSSYLEETGITELISLIKSYYLDDYELYLIRNLHCEDSKISNRHSLKEHLEIYYHFLAVFNLPISVFGLTDEEILGHRLLENNDYFLDETYTKLYGELKKKIKSADRIRYQKKMVKIVKENSIHNMVELNKALVELLEISDEFKQQLLKPVND
jgi:hypothetical protein